MPREQGNLLPLNVADKAFSSTVWSTLSRITIFSSLSLRILIKHQVLSTNFIGMLEAEPEMQPCMVCISALLILSGIAS